MVFKPYNLPIMFRAADMGWRGEFLMTDPSHKPPGVVECVQVDGGHVFVVVFLKMCVVLLEG